MNSVIRHAAQRYLDTGKWKWSSKNILDNKHADFEPVAKNQRMMMWCECESSDNENDMSADALSDSEYEEPERQVEGNNTEQLI